ncbi:MAG: hypothetical protein U9O89_07085 [Thermoproteota archaeon]|nr:hypothetical protein [Thermoproteota archaeon]
MTITKSFTCPYKKCGKKFQKPVMLTDSSKIPRETYYVCPHCHSKLEIILKDQKNLNSISVKTSGNPAETQVKNLAPPNCPHYFGYLKTLSDDAPIPDECSTCPEIMRCFVKNH